ncbi:MAG: alkaline shock response membrane anchor protein AmaP [Clostridia bacterium]
MKFLEKIGLVVFSNIILILSIVMCLMIFGWIDTSMIKVFMDCILENQIATNITLGIAIAFILLAIKCIFFDSTTRPEVNAKDGVLLQNENGKLLISKDTLENLVNGVAKGFSEAENVSTKVGLDAENNVTVYVTLYVTQNAVIKDLSNNLQTKIKAAVKKASDLDVKEVNIRVKNIAPKKEMIQD